MNLTETLAGIIRLPGVRGALIVAVEDGIVVADRLMEGVDGAAVAALAASLANRMRTITSALEMPDPVLMHLGGTEGSLVAAMGGQGLLIVAVATPEANPGELRLSLLDAAGRTS